jgi:polyisoprenoid-binding protein YceI
MLKASLFLIVFSIGTTAISQNVDSEKSKVYFEISNMYINSVKGVFKDVSGEVTLSPTSGEQYMHICLQTNTIDTKNKKRDEHLKSKDFFHISKFPQICFTAHSLTQVKTGSYKATGILNMHGINKELEVPITIENGKLTSMFEVDRTDFFIGGKYNGFTVGNTVKLNVELILL